MSTSRRVTALIPAAGHGTRLGNSVPGSKEVVDVGGIPAMGHLLQRLELARVHRGLVVLRNQKWDVPEALLEYRTEVLLSYVIVEETPSQLHSVTLGLGFLDSELVVFGYPDILFEPEDAFASLLDRQSETGADVVMGLFPSDIPERVDMVALDDESRPVELVIKQPSRGLLYSWSIAVWTPAFSKMLIDFVRMYDAGEDMLLLGAEEPVVGHVIQKALDDGLDVEAVVFPNGEYLDIGTPEDLNRARRRFH